MKRICGECECCVLMVVVDCRTRTRAAGSKKKQVRVSIYTPLAKQWRTTIFGMALSGNVSPWGCPDLAMVSGRLIGGWAVACLGPRPCSSQRLMLGYDSAQLLPQCQEYQWSTSGGRHCRILELFLAFLSAVCELQYSRGSGSTVAFWIFRDSATRDAV